MLPVGLDIFLRIRESVVKIWTMQQSLFLCSVRANDICVGLTVSGVVTDNRHPLVLHKRLILNNEVVDFASILLKPNPDSILISDHLDICLVNRRALIIYEQRNKSRNAPSLCHRSLGRYSCANGNPDLFGFPGPRLCVHPPAGVQSCFRLDSHLKHAGMTTFAKGSKFSAASSRVCGESLSHEPGRAINKNAGRGMRGPVFFL